MGDERRAAKGHLVFPAQNPVDGVLFSARLHRLQQRYVLGHRHHLRAGHLFDQRITFLVIAMGMVSQQDLDVRKFEPKVGDRFRDRWHIALVSAVDENISLRCNDKERAQSPGSDVIDVANDLVRWERRRPVFRRAHVPRQYRTRSIGMSSDADRRMIGRRWILCKRAGARTQHKRPKQRCDQLRVFRDFVHDHPEFKSTENSKLRKFLITPFQASDHGFRQIPPACWLLVLRLARARGTVAVIRTGLAKFKGDLLCDFSS